MLPTSALLLSLLGFLTWDTDTSEIPMEPLHVLQSHNITGRLRVRRASVSNDNKNPRRSDVSENVRGVVSLMGSSTSNRNTVMTNDEVFPTKPYNTEQEDCPVSLEKLETRPEELGARAGQLLAHLGVPSFALVTHCDAEVVSRATADIMQASGDRGVPVCLFSSLAALSQAVMSRPNHARCFIRRRWTVALLGTPTWAARVVDSAKRTGLYDERVHWVILVVGSASPVTPTLPLYRLTHRVTWLRWTSRVQGWVVLVSEATHMGVAAREAGRWVGRGRQALLRVSRSLTPSLLTNFFRIPLRVISRYPTTAEIVPDKVGRCYYYKDGGDRGSDGGGSDGGGVDVGGSTRCTGYVGVMLTMVASNLNLTIVNKSVYSCGIAHAKGTRVTIIAKDEADTALGTCSITANRLQVVDFTEFFAVTRSSIVTREPSVMLSALLIFDVLSWQTWSVVGGYVVVVTVVVCGVARVLGRVHRPYADSLTNGFAIVTKAFLLQAHSPQPRSSSGRALMAMSWVVVISVVGIYSGNLTAWFSIPRFEKPVESLADLAARPDIVPIVKENDPNYIMFVNKTEGNVGVISKRLTLRGADTDEELMSKVVYGKAAYMNSDRSHLIQATKLNKLEGRLGFVPCRIHLGAEDIRQDYLALMTNKNSWIKEQINHRIRWLRSYGVVQYLYRQFNPPGCRIRTTGDRKGGSQSLTLRHLQGVFWVWLGGLGAATLLLLTDMVVAGNVVDEGSHH